MAENNIGNKRVVSYTIKIEQDLLNRFKEKILSEGFGIQEGFNYLIKNYVEEDY